MGMDIATIEDAVGGPIAWRSAGSLDLPVAVFFHGLGGRRTDWDLQLSALSDVRRCSAWDQPGYGASAGLISSLPDLASTAASWIEGLGAGAVDVVGLSFGGMLAQHLALDHPHLVRTLALLDTSPAFGLDGATTKEDWLASRVTPLHDSTTSAERTQRVVAGLVGREADEDVRRTALESMRAVPTESLIAACRALVDHNTLDRLHEIRIPSVVIVGAEDSETPPSYSATIARKIPGARLIAVPGAGHLVNLEAPKVVNDELRAHWIRNGDRADGG